jgi:drug/metabolite transporter (DMT)-like permease
VLAEKPGFTTLLGGAVVLIGLYLLLHGYRPSRQEAAPLIKPVS